MKNPGKNILNEVSTVVAPGEKKVDVSGDSDHTKFLEYRDMGSLIPSEQREWIIETIFFNDAEKYNQTIRMFNWIECWEDASDLLDLIFPKNKLNPKSEEAREFSAIIRNYFDE